jgi:hypothetical protein
MLAAQLNVEDAMGRLLIIFAVICFCLTSGVASAQQEHSVRIDLATASVVAESGYVNFRLEPTAERLSFPNKSFFTIKIGDKIYTNNDNPPAGVTPLPPATTISSLDKISTTWDVSNAKIEQHVQSRLNANSEMVLGVNYEVTNQSKSEISVETQYLLDVSIDGSDVEQYLLQGDLRTNWTRHLSPTPNFIGFLEREFQAPMFDPGIVTELTFDNSMLVQPSMLLVGSWEQLERIAFVDPSMSVPSQKIMDAAVIMQWDKETLLPGGTQDVGTFYYGPGSFSPSSVSEKTEPQCKIWPNPVSNDLHVRTNAMRPARIQNLLGQTVWTGTITSDGSTIDVSSLEPGSYFLSIAGRTMPFVVSR